LFCAAKIVVISIQRVRRGERDVAQRIPEEHRKVQKLEAALEAVTARLTKQETDLQQARA